MIFIGYGNEILAAQHLHVQTKELVLSLCDFLQTSSIAYSDEISFL